MLVLTRRVGETICMGSSEKLDTEVTVLDVRGNQVRIGIRAPGNILILREEVKCRDEAEKEKIAL